MSTHKFKTHSDGYSYDTRNSIDELNFSSHKCTTETDPLESEDNPCYNNNQIINIRRVYLFALIGWIILIALYKLIPPSDVIEAIILFLPVLVFIISYVSVPEITYKVEKYMFKANLLTLGLLVALPLLNWIYTNHNENRALFIKLAATAIIFSMVTLIDVWVPRDHLPVVKHIKSVLQTMAITLLIFGLYRFFIDQTQENNMKKEISTSI